MISSPSAQIVNAIAESHFVTVNGDRVSAYGPTMAVATAIIALGVAVTASLGPERRGRHFESAVVGQSVVATSSGEKAGDVELGWFSKKKTAAPVVEISELQ